ncbi:hypothetical protein ES319_A06G185600v1 [Gossypium barbadense]|uniref:Uncharacterized protein n=2 Tax=Gossypium TaxID=3633 RepID=A0A5J5VH58_GOSBA|nr:hypothetical protein ES319_A06G185600v1 [Gossypium barbadense]TYH14303.1 hypothetical protein ES288_A06G209200v1 [Gossypium darwinii]
MEPSWPTTTQEKREGLSCFFVPRPGHWPNLQGFSDLQIGERTPEHTQTVNRRCKRRGEDGVWWDKTAHVVALLMRSGG